MNFIKYVCYFNNTCDEMNYDDNMNKNDGNKCNDNDENIIIKSNTIHFHELSCSFESIKRFTIVTDKNGKTIIKPYPFIYLGYPYVESDTDL